MFNGRFDPDENAPVKIVVTRVYGLGKGASIDFSEDFFSPQLIDSKDLVQYEHFLWVVENSGKRLFCPPQLGSKPKD